MAIPAALSEYNAFTTDHILPRTTQVIYDNDPLWVRLQSKNAERFAGGLTIRHPIIMGELNGDWIGRGEAVNTDYCNTDAAFYIGMKFAYVGITLYRIDGVYNQGPAAAFSQIESKFLNASMKLGKILSQGVYKDGQSAGREKAMNGLEEWLDDGNDFPTIGGISRSDIFTVGSVGGLNSYTATWTSFSLNQLRRAMTAAAFGPDYVDLIPTTPNGYNLFWEALQPSMRYMSSDNDLCKIGMQNYRIDQADVSVSRYCPTGSTGRTFGLCTKYIRLYFPNDPLFQFGFTGFKEAQNSLGDVVGQFAVGVNMIYENPRCGFKIKSSTLF